MYRKSRIQLLGLLLVAICDCALADHNNAPSEIDFVRHIQPVLRKHCYQCHGPDSQEADLRLDIAAHALAGSENGPVIVPGAPEKSVLLKLISGAGDDGRFMPPRDEGAPLTSSQVALIREWIEAGADWPATVDASPSRETALWSFKPLRRPRLPTVKRSEWVRNSIDAFLISELERAGLEPAPPATPRALLRRASFDLLGLPPDIGDLDRVTEAMYRPGQYAYERYLDQLLASPHYGERWGRHWLDLVRYADTNGYEADKTKPLAWKYRDYVIRALNNDTPYDRFIVEQLAGDELPDATSETVIATGFYRMGPWDAERAASVQPSEVVAERFNELDDMVSTTSQVFLGLTLGCARCHNHKFDPLTARDYYSMVSIFNPLTRHTDRRTELTRPAVPPRELQAKTQADARIAELEDQIRTLAEPLRHGLLESGQPITYPAGPVTKPIPDDAVAALLIPADQRSESQQQLATRFSTLLDDFVAGAVQQKEIASRFLADKTVLEIEAAQREVTELSGRFEYPQAYILYEPSAQAPVTYLLKRGNPTQPDGVVEPAVPAAIPLQAGRQPPEFEPPDRFTSRRRISLARWIADRDNPLTARVIVNRVWQFHFGAGLVRTPSDFGRRGTPPTHPELLDWLADWFVHDADWSLKDLHRLIMTSSAYRMGKVGDESQADADPDNRLWWRVPYRRLEAEAIRDSMLAASGRLDRTLYGPSMYPHIPQDARRSGYNPQAVWKDFDERTTSRRTIYAYVKRTLIVPFLDTLDFCETTRSADRRTVTTVAPQALELLNGDFVNRQAKHLADRLLREAGTDVNCQIDYAYQLALSRPATPDEIKVLQQFWNRERTELLEQQDVTADEARQQALVQVCRVIFNLNEFVYTD